MYNIISSLLDTDFYVFTQMQAVFHKYTWVNVQYDFKWRNFTNMKFNIPMLEFKKILDTNLDNLCKLKFTDHELRYLKNIPYLKDDFIEYLKLFKLNRQHIDTSINDDNTISIIIKGPWLNTIMFETPVLAIISEIYSIQLKHISESDVEDVISEKIILLNDSLSNNIIDESFKFSDFGTRRRAGWNIQNLILGYLHEDSTNFVGTSNVYFAMKYGINPIGTMSHQFIQAYQQLGTRLIDSQKDALQSWVDEYRGELGIALSDCITFDAFLIDFDRYFALLFDGCRHDSGDPVEWANKLIAHYKNLRIDPMTKTAVFSDGLTLIKAINLYIMFKNKIKMAFGIGTSLTNDCGFEPPQIVIKMTECNDGPVAKISDSPGKGMCNDSQYLKYLSYIIDKKINNLYLK